LLILLLIGRMSYQNKSEGKIMNLEEILNKVNQFKLDHTNSTLDIIVEHVKDLDDFYGEVYILATNSSDELVADTLLLSVEDPTSKDLEELQTIADALKEKL